MSEEFENSGTAEELAADEQDRKVYLGSQFELRKKQPREPKKPDFER